MSGNTTNNLPQPIASTATVTQVAENFLGSMFSLTGILTDATPGSIVRTYGEAVGAIVEMASATATASTFQGGVYGAYAAFGITPTPATAATTTVVFSSPSPVVTPVYIPSGTILATTSGIQFATDQTVTLGAGQTSVSVGATALVPGSQGNVPANSIVQILSGISYPLSVTNPSPATGGQNEETAQETANRFATTIASLGKTSPYAIANAVIGVDYNGEIVQQASVYEPWITTPSCGAGFTIYIDNGSGTASTNLVNQVVTFLNTAPGYRPAGVPYYVQAVSGIPIAITVTGTVFPQYASQIGSITTSIQNSIEGYMGTLQIGQTLYLGNIVAVAANAVPSALSNINVVFSTGTEEVTASYNQRVVASSINIDLSTQ